MIHLMQSAVDRRADDNIADMLPSNPSHSGGHATISILHLTMRTGKAAPSAIGKVRVFD
ncbi:hypothetical protein OE766_24085 [Pararhizobium sp. YC-54]|uniref:hypothetical protein n=1 Tax=Pararhizobium sp. YC-54 TaxID=2986920 RepID=UPI0021F704AF|nr:hypothetical protein [Pararhizobium sp. YC-54]MCW0001307.1 hypothetical protein [Pararhizobium sp. YC-54]